MRFLVNYSVSKKQLGIISLAIKASVAADEATFKPITYSVGNKCSNRTVHYDVYPMDVFRDGVLPEFIEGGAQDNCSVLLIGMHGTVKQDVDQFPGTVVYINGEPHAQSISDGHYYLGPLTADVPHRTSFQFYYVSFIFLVNPMPSLAFLEEEQRSDFLLYRSSRCFNHRETAFDAFSTIGYVHAGGKCHGKTEKFTQVNFDSNPSLAYKRY
jgi:hypothetical protein